MLAETKNSAVTAEFLIIRFLYLLDFLISHFIINGALLVVGVKAVVVVLISPGVEAVATQQHGAGVVQADTWYVLHNNAFYHACNSIFFFVPSWKGITLSSRG